jgi:hypothetical protein
LFYISDLPKYYFDSERYQVQRNPILIAKYEFYYFIHSWGKSQYSIIGSVLPTRELKVDPWDIKFYIIDFAVAHFGGP